MKKIAVVEDDVDSNKLVVEILEDEGYECASYFSAEEIILALDSNKRFDLLIMDVGLPGVDGTLANSIIKGNDQFSNVPIIAVTGNIRIDKEHFDGFFLKPFLEDELVQKVQELLQ